MDRLISEKLLLRLFDGKVEQELPLFSKTMTKIIKRLPSTEPQVEQWKDFVLWVAKEIFDDMWEYNKDAFAEIACRKLNKLGIVKANGDKWELVESYEGMTNGEVLKVVFPHEDVYKGEFGYDLGGCTIDFDWWNSPYEPGKERMNENSD